MVRVRVKEPDPLQKPWVSLRFRMAQLGQRRQRLKIFLPLDRTRKESLLPSTKIRNRWRSHQIFGATALRFSSSAVCHACEGLGFPFPVPSILAHLRLEQYLLECCQSKYGDFGVPASSSLPPPVPSRLAWLLLEQGRGSSASASSSLPLPVPSVLALLLLEIN